MTIDNAHIKATVIKKRDKDFPDWLDFTALRNEGLRHLGALSGKLWTDHNIHDPGITTLEVLSYAILDLGYRTSRPLENLLAPTTDEPDDNFFTPNQILTNNPLTITDYRKLLLSLPEVRNAWLTVSEGSTINVVAGSGKDNSQNLVLTLNGLYKVTIEPNFDWVKTYSHELSDTRIDPSVIRPKISHADLIQKVTKLLNAHRNLCEDFEGFSTFNADNQRITNTGSSNILRADPLVVKGMVLLQTDADAARVYADIHRAIAEFMAPSPRFYTLQELLEKGKTIEEIYEGRPSMSMNFPTLQAILERNGGQILDNTLISEALLSKATFSELNLGFIDTDELHAIQPRKEIHISDLYNLVSQIDGVQSVQNLQLEKEKTLQTEAGNTLSIVDIKNWCYKMGEGNTPVLEDLVLTLKKGATSAVRTVNDLSNFDKKGGNSRNGIFANEPLPYGAALEDLGDYYSIQRDYPRVYRIGEGGLSAKATDVEVAQVRQFKGYLLFFERILTDYLAQLTHIRDIFSMTPDSQRSAAQKHTYYTGSLDNVPDGDVLLRFARSEAGDAALTTALAVPTEGSLLATIFDNLIGLYSKKPADQRITKLEDILLEVDFLQIFAENAPKNAANPAKGLQPQSFSTVFQRDAVADLVQRNLVHEHFETDIYEDAYGFFFTIVPSVGGTILLSRVHYSTKKEAREAAALTALVGSYSTGFRLVNRPNAVVSDSFYAFDIVSSPAENLDLLSQSLENPTQYATRRNILLDHLLARFAEQFTDYATLMYGVFTDKTEDKARTAEDKAQFLANYDTSSQNRARALDYTEGGWLSANVSGFETRLKALAGIQDVRRRTLCPFVIDECADEFQVKITDATGAALFETAEAFPRDVAATVVRSFTEGGQSVGNFVPFETASNGFGFEFQTPTATLKHPVLYASQMERDQKIAAIHAVFRQNQAENEVFISSTNWKIELHEAKSLPDLTFDSAINLNLTASAAAKKSPVQVGSLPFKTSDDALRNTNNFTKSLKKQGLSLHADPQQVGVFMNMDALKPTVSTLPPVYRWHIFENDIIKESGHTETTDEAAALTDFITAKTVDGVTICQNIHVLQVVDGYKWCFVVDGAVLFSSLAVFSDRETALSAAFLDINSVRDAKRYFKSGDEFNANFTFLLRDESLRFMARHPLVFATEKEREKAMKNVQKLLKNAQNPLKIQAEQPRFVWNMFETPPKPSNTEGSSLLKSFSYFDSKENAVADFNLTLHLAGKAAYYNVHPIVASDSKTTIYTFDIVQEDKTVAIAPTAFESMAACENARDVLVQRVADNRFIVQTYEYPDRYKFQYFPLATDTTPLFVSEKDFGSAAEASEGFAAFVEILHTKTLADNGLHTRDGERVAQLLGTSEQSVSFMEDVKKLRDTEGVVAAAVQKSARSAQGQYVYRMLNKDAPLALAMDEKGVYQTKNEQEAAKKLDELCKKTSRACPVLSLCLDGDNVICIGNQWHYVLKTNHLARANETMQPPSDTILLVSWTGYDTKAEAHAAFAENYVGDITVAANLANYNAANGVYYGEMTDETAQNGENTEGSLDMPNGTSRAVKYRVFVPPMIKRLYSKEQLAAFAQAYPLREEPKTALDAAKNAKKQFSFVLYDCATGVLDWKSATLFDTPDAALAAWRQFHAMLGVAGACRLSKTDDCGYSIGLFDILLESVNRFPKEAAWAQVAKLTDSATKTDALYVHQDDNRMERWSFLGVGACFRLATSPLLFSSAQECKAFLGKLTAADAKIDLEPAIFKARKAGQKVFFTEIKADNTPVPCGCPPQEATTFAHRQTLLTFLDGTEQCLPNDAAKLLDFVKKTDNYRIIQAKEQAAYTFELVDNSQILARHPLNYTTRLETDATVEHADYCLHTEGSHFIEKILLRPRTAAERERCTLFADNTCCLPYLNEADVCTATTELQADCDECPDDIDARSLLSSAIIVGNTVEQVDCYLPEADPYSFVIQVVMPSWGRRFGNPNFRRELERLFANEAPAHIWLNIDYKNAQDLCAFETKYRQWLCDFKGHPSGQNLLGDCPQRTDVTTESEDTSDFPPAQKDPSVISAFAATSTVAEANQTAVAPKSKGKAAKKSVETPISIEKLDKTATETVMPSAIENEKTAETATPSATTDAQATDNDRFMRRRLMQYSDNIRDIADAKLLKTESYKQTAFFLQNDGNVKALTLLVDLMTTKSLGKKGGATDAQYITLLQNAVGYALDKLVIAAPNAVAQAEVLRGIAEKLLAQNIDIESLMTAWKGEELTERLGATVVEDYHRLIA
jgi:hypothetical protein